MFDGGIGGGIGVLLIGVQKGGILFLFIFFAWIQQFFLYMVFDAVFDKNRMINFY